MFVTENKLNQLIEQAVSARVVDLEHSFTGRLSIVEKSFIAQVAGLEKTFNDNLALLDKNFNKAHQHLTDDIVDRDKVWNGFVAVADARDKKARIEHEAHVKRNEAHGAQVESFLSMIKDALVLLGGGKRGNSKAAK
jgi:hypothetical protein